MLGAVKDFFRGGDVTAADELEKAKQESSAYVTSGMMDRDAALDPRGPSGDSGSSGQGKPLDLTGLQQTNTDLSNPSNAAAIREAEKTAQAAVESAQRMAEEGRKAGETTTSAVAAAVTRTAPKH
jgi:hypothetical protein